MIISTQYLNVDDIYLNPNLVYIRRFKFVGSLNGRLVVHIALHCAQIGCAVRNSLADVYFDLSAAEYKMPSFT